MFGKPTVEQIEGACCVRIATFSFTSQPRYDGAAGEPLTADLQKVSAQVEMSRPAPQMVFNNQ
jgi:hypothetical protein